ncbi:MAG TPA: DUF1566 domain-containing protein [Spirochaetota bacterium]|nr:DUF1566 domain-containing protein [Spirochaetota bacterium]HPU90479.1 DUF1566 domain-containing protein [Spirochaetota bacterium]
MIFLCMPLAPACFIEMERTNPNDPQSDAFSSPLSSAAGQPVFYVMRTGQENSVSLYDDGYYKKGYSWKTPRFINLGDGTVRDNLTGLMWTADANIMKTRDPKFDGDGTAEDGLVTWYHAMDYISKLNGEKYLGYSDWRAPNANELMSLIDFGQAYIYTWLMSEGFSNVPLNARIWSSTTNPDLSYNSAFFVDLITAGGAWMSFKTEFYYIWPVRGENAGSERVLQKTGQTVTYYTNDDGRLRKGEPWPEPRFTDNSNGTITDNLTALVWAKDGNIMVSRNPGYDVDGTANDGRVAFTTALNYIALLNTENYLGFSDWRLPNVREFTSLWNFSYHIATWLQNQGFTNVQNYYITSTGYGAIPIDRSYHIGIYVPRFQAQPKTYSDYFFYVIPVRGGR